MAMLRIGPKGQVVLPKALREGLFLVPGDKVVFSIEDGKGILVPVPSRTAAELKGILSTSAPVDLGSARQDYQDHLVEKYSPGKNNG